MAMQNNSPGQISKTCRACIQKCLTTNSSTLPENFSFFKLMMGNYSSFLEIPSECANRIPNQACTDAILEASSGHLWHVKLRRTGISASFKDGWEEFVSDNSIEAEDIVVFRHVVTMHFLVQIFGSNGYEKQTTFTIEYHQLHCLKERNLAPVRIQRRFEHEGETGDPSTCVGNSFDVQQNIEELRPDRLAQGLNKISSKHCIAETEKTHTRAPSSMGIKMQIAEALAKCDPLRPSRINAKDATRLPKAKFHDFGSQMGLCAEHPIVVDSEEELNAQGSSVCEHLQATVEVCDSSSLEDSREKSSYYGVAPTKGVQFPQAPCTDTGKQRNAEMKTIRREEYATRRYSTIGLLNMKHEAANSIKTSKPKFTVVVKKTAVQSFWLNVPSDFAIRWLPQDKINVLLMTSTGEWWVTFVGNRISRRLGSGFKQFVVDNKLEKGDTCVFELVDGVEYIFKVHVFKSSDQDGPARKKMHRGRVKALGAHDQMLNRKSNFQWHKKVSEDQLITHDKMQCSERRKGKRKLRPRGKRAKR